MVLFAAGCASESPPAQIGADTVPAASQVPTTTTIPPETTTSIDFDAPTDQLTTALGDTPTVDETAEVIDDMRGVTTDLTGQMGRLTGFIPLATAKQGIILDLAVTAEPVEERGHSVVASVTANVPGDARSVAALIEDELRATGWNRATQEDLSTERTTAIDTVYRIPGTPGDQLELTVGVTGSATEATVLKLRYHTEDVENEPVFDRLRAWQADLPLPSGAVATATSITTVDDRAILSASYEAPAETTADARQAMSDRFPRSGYELADGNDESEASSEPLLVVDPDGERLQVSFATTNESEIIELVATTEFDLQPVG